MAMIHAFIVLKNVCSKVLWKNGSVSAKRSGLNPVSFSACSSAFAALYSRLCSNRSGKPPDCAIWSWCSSSAMAAESNSLMAPVSDAEFPVVGCVKFDQVYRAVLLKISVVRQVLTQHFCSLIIHSFIHFQDV